MRYENEEGVTALGEASVLEDLLEDGRRDVALGIHVCQRGGHVGASDAATMMLLHCKINGWKTFSLGSLSYGGRRGK